MIWLIFLRILVELLIGVIGGAWCLVLVGIGRKDEAVSVALVCAVIVFFVRPNNEDRALFAEYQKQHTPR